MASSCSSTAATRPMLSSRIGNEGFLGTGDGPGGPCRSEPGPVKLVEGRPVGDVGHVDGGRDELFAAGAGRLLMVLPRHKPYAPNEAVERENTA